MAITDNKKIIIKVCKYYFEDGLNQKEISARLSISRPQISRILAHARSANIVSVKINDPFEQESKMEFEIAEKYGLSDVVVLNSKGYEEDPFNTFVKKAAMQLEAYIPDSSTVGVMSGRTLSGVVRKISHLDRKNISVVPLVGGDGFNGSDWHANVIAQSLAKKAGGKYYFLNAPVVMENPKATDIMKQEPSIAEILNRGRMCDVSIIGIGNINEQSTSGQASRLTAQEVKILEGLGAVASACVSYINKEGGIIKSDISDRLIGQSIKDLKRSKVIAIAMGTAKTEAIKAVLLTKCVNVLFTDLETAQSILNN